MMSHDACDGIDARQRAEPVLIERKAETSAKNTLVLEVLSEKGAIPDVDLIATFDKHRWPACCIPRSGGRIGCDRVQGSMEGKKP